MKQGYILLALGDPAGARRAFRRVLGAWPRRRHDPDAMLAITNCLAGDAARLQGVNAVLTRAGLSPVTLRRPDQPLGLDNIRSDAPPARPAAPGRVSVIMPAYNAAATIEAALRSLMEQSVRDLEIVVVDDASTDATAAAVEALAREDRAHPAGAPGPQRRRLRRRATAVSRPPPARSSPPTTPTTGRIPRRSSGSSRRWPPPPTSQRSAATGSGCGPTSG